MAFRLAQEVPREFDELVEVAAGAELRINAGIDRVDADAQPLERRREQLRADFLCEQQTIRADARLRKKPDRIIKARIEERLPHLVQPLEPQAGAVNLLLGTFHERPVHVLVWTPEHRQRTHAAAQIALRGQLQADLDPAGREFHTGLTKRFIIAPYSCQEYRRALSAAARSMSARFLLVKNSSTARASATGSSGGTRIPLWPSMISGSPPTEVAITGREKWKAVNATPLCASDRYGARTTSAAAKYVAISESGMNRRSKRTFGCSPYVAFHQGSPATSSVTSVFSCGQASSAMSSPLNGRMWPKKRATLPARPRRCRASEREGISRPSSCTGRNAVTTRPPPAARRPPSSASVLA